MGGRGELSPSPSLLFSTLYQRRVIRPGMNERETEPLGPMLVLCPASCVQANLRGAGVCGRRKAASFSRKRRPYAINMPLAADQLERKEENHQKYGQLMCVVDSPRLSEPKASCAVTSSTTAVSH